jgi:uncharacterized protein YbcI
VCAAVSGCLSVWPILAAHGSARVGAGVTSSLLGTTTVLSAPTWWCERPNGLIPRLAAYRAGVPRAPCRNILQCTMAAPKARTKPRNHGDVLTAISDGMVALLKEFYGRGPTRAKSYFEDDLVVCVLRGGFSRVEQTLLEGGRGSAVIEQRMAFQDLMRDRFEGVIEAATGQRVIGFMSGNQQDPDMMCEVFILAPAELVDEYELSAPPMPADS